MMNDVLWACKNTKTDIQKMREKKSNIQANGSAQKFIIHHS
jgi:hypothetical protein